MKVKLPAIEVIEKLTNKNLIKHHIHPALEFESNEIESDIGCLRVKYGDQWYFFTSKDELITDDIEIAIKCNKLPTPERIENNEINLKWTKHPLLRDYSVKEILDSWVEDFNIVEEDRTRGILGLRSPQVGALYGVLAHWKASDDIATVVLPTGTGKTETMLCLMVSNRCENLLVTVPSDSLREQLADKFYSLGLLKKFGLVGEKSLYPKVGVLREKFTNENDLTEFFVKCNVVISTMQLVAGSSLENQILMSTVCDYLFIDEAHHVKAKTWNSFRETFKAKRTLQFTATPFRNDREKIDGKFAFNFPLSKAQSEGYFKKINFVSVREYDPRLVDGVIADKAIEKLREDREAGFEHILMARCANKKRADEIFELYSAQKDLNPVKIYTGVKDKTKILERIKSKDSQIIICVDMLGEGFDLPELKIAAFHDIRKSLPITLQLAGRFTRTNLDGSLGEATIVANIADLDVKNELEELYAQDSDWNVLLPAFSTSQIEKEIEFAEFIDGFKKIENSNVPIQNIKPAFSTVVYKNVTDTWSPRNFKEGLTAVDSYEYLFYDINSDDNVFLIITGRTQEIDWGISKDIQDIIWDVFIIFWETRENLLFIHTSEKKGNYRDLAKAIVGEQAQLIDKLDVYKSFHNVKRVRLQNVGLKEFLGKNIRFRMTFGADIEEALSKAESARAQKAFVQGVGYEEGKKVSIGASSKGRIWSHQRGNVKEFMNWATELGKKLNNDNVDPNTILRNTLIPTLISETPNAYPILVDWDEELYIQSETRFSFSVGNRNYDLSNCELGIRDGSDTRTLLFELITDDSRIQIKQILYLETIDQDGQSTQVPAFRFEKLGDTAVTVTHGTKSYEIADFFEKYIPTFWFSDGSALTGNEYIELKQEIQHFNRESIQTWDWTGVDISKESQHVQPKIQNSIQYKVIEVLKAKDYDVVYDDDYSGEIADVITVKNEGDKLVIEFYHLKYASGGNVNNQISNLYEVCGQAQKSIHWKHKTGREFFNHLLRRETKTRNNESCSRIEKGTKEDLETFESLAKSQIPMDFKVFIVQPSISKNNASDSILTLLGVTENFLMEMAAIKLAVIASN